MAETCDQSPGRVIPGAAQRAQEDTIVALATPPGHSALGIVRLSGARCQDVARDLFGAAPFIPRRISTRRLFHKGALIDKVVVLFWQAPNTPTGEDVLEIISHGSPSVLREIVAACVNAGARTAAPGEFTRRAYIHGRVNITQAQAVNELILARTSADRAAALTRLEGGLTEALSLIRKPLLSLLAQIEVRLDHPDEDIAPLSSSDFEAILENSIKLINRLTSTHERGQNRRDGKRIGLIGPPNAGKSTLFNALLGRQRAITSPMPGTTRDYLEEEIIIEGQSMCLIDTAGFHGAPRDSVEQEGIRRSNEVTASCDLILRVVDANLAGNQSLQTTPNSAGSRELVIMNKSDLLATKRLNNDGVFYCSALTGEGIDVLLSAIATAINHDTCLQTEYLLTDIRGRDCLRSAAAAIDEARQALILQNQSAPELAAHFIRKAISDIDQTEGRGLTDSVLDEIFSQFCIGK